MYVSDNIPECRAESFDDITSNCTLYVPTGYKSAYQEAEGWKEFENIVEYDPVEDLMQYDINHDGHVNVADLIKLSDIILKHPELY